MRQPQVILADRAAEAHWSVSRAVGWTRSGDEVGSAAVRPEFELVCVTRGARGSVLVSEHECVSDPGFAVKVVDSAGASDAFTACGEGVC